MSAVLLAVFNEHAAADRVRTALVKDGFPTDRVELTSARDPGQAKIQPAASQRAKFEQYFSTLLSGEGERLFVKTLIERIDRGAAAVAVHPRGSVETARAAQILEHAGAVEVRARDLDDQFLEQAASREDGYWVRHLLPESLSAEE
jgi:hypothetical protein